MSFDINLRALNLNLLEDFVTQKCLLPEHKWPSLSWLPGSTVKCVFNNDFNTICHIYSRPFPKEENCCYLDSCVSFGKPESTDSSLSLKSLVLLREVLVPMINVQVELTEESFLKYIEKTSIETFKMIIAMTLKSLWLVPNCTVKHKNLQILGIEAVYVQAVGNYENDVYFCLHNDAKVNIDEFHITSAKSLPSFHCSGFENAQKALTEILDTMKMQSNRPLNHLRVSNNALIVGPSGCGKTSLLNQFFKEHNFNCFFITAANILSQYPGETEAELRRIFKAAKIFVNECKPKYPTAILIEDLHLLCPSTKKTQIGYSTNDFQVSAQILSLVDDLTVTCQNIICIATTTGPEKINEVARRPGRFDNEISISIPTMQQREELFKALFNEHCAKLGVDAPITPNILELVCKQTQGFVASDMVVFVYNIARTMQRDPKCDLTAVITETLEKVKPIASIGTDVIVSKTEKGFDAIGGMQMLKRNLEISVIAKFRQKEAFRRFGLSSLPKGILFYGPPGCAKTTFAKCLAYEANMTFISTSAAEVYSPYVGCAEKFITKIFDTARKNAPCLIFLDEIDALVGRRALGSNNSNDVQTRILSTLLTEMDGIITDENMDIEQHILVVGATNRPDMLDEALKRPGRFDKLLHVPVPDLISRRSILGLCTQNMPLAYDVDLDYLAARTENYSGADLCNLCNEAALQSLLRDFNAKEILKEDFEMVLETLKSSLTVDQLVWYRKYERSLRI